MAQYYLSPEDQSFGPQYPGRFDFTLAFEDVVFTIIPAAIFVAATLGFIAHERSKSAVVGTGPLFWLKMLAGGLLVILESIQLGFWAKASLSATSIAAPTLSVAAALVFIPALFLEHTRSYSPSILLSSYFSLVTLFGIVKSRSYLTRHEIPPVGYIAAIATGVKLMVVILEEWPKRTSILESDLKHALSSESVAGLWSRAVFWWINSTLMKGFKSLFRIHDLENLEQDFTADHLHARFMKNWSLADKNSHSALLYACIKTLWKESLMTMFPKALMAAFMSTQPYMTKTVVQQASVADTPQNIVGGLAAAAVFVYAGSAITAALGEYFMSRQMVMTRTVILSAIFGKLFELEAETLKRTNAVTLSSADVNNIMMSVLSFHRMWQNGLLVLAGCIILGFLVGTAAVFILIPTLITLIISTRLAASIRPAQKIWNAALDARITSTTDTLASIINVKMSGLTDVATSSIQQLMREEAKSSQKFRALKTWNYSIGETTGNWAAVAVLAGALFWSRAATGLSISDIYATLSVCVLITDPLASFTDGLTLFNGALASFDRIQKFLATERITDSREDLTCGQPETEKLDDKDEETVAELLDVSTKPYHANGTQVFRHLSVRFPANKVSVIVGPVGSGKSTLLKIITGEVGIADGRVFLDQDAVAYCGQTPWLENVSLKDNILGDYPFSELRYAEAINACCLTADISSFNEGDDYVVGDNGGNLSGGQRQRVALARAIYTAKPLLILDDPLSGLDQDTSKTIFANLLGEDGLLRKARSSVILATTVASHVRSAHQVVTVGRSGTVRVEQAQNVVIPSYLSRETSIHHSDSESEIKRKHNQKPKSLAVKQALAKQPDVMGEHDLARQRGDVGIYGLYLRALRIKRFAIWIALMFIGCLANRFPLIFVRIWYSMDPNNKVYFVGFACISAASVFAWLAAYWYWYNYLVMDTTVSLHNSLLDTVMHSTLAFLTRTENASLVNRFSEDISIFSQRLPAVMVGNISSMLFVLIDLGLLCSFSAVGVTILPVCIIPFYFLQRFYLRSSRQLRQLQLETQVPVVKQVTEVSMGIDHIRPMKLQGRLKEHGHRVIDESTKPVYYMRCIQQWLSLIVKMELMVVSVVLIVVSLTSKHLASANAVGVGMVTLIPLSEQLGLAVRSWTEVEIALGAMARLKWFTQNTPTEANATASDEAKNLLASWPVSGKVEFTKVCASYQIGAPLVLSNISFVAEPGANLGITGRTGSGKSTILLTSLGFLDYQGSILIDGTELRSVPLDILRSRITTITQSSIELPGTVRHNLCPDVDTSSLGIVPDGLLVEMLERLGLWEYVDMYGGLDADMKVLGLSQGQRQLLNIARAMVHQAHNKTKIVMMDEVSTCFNEVEGTRVLEVLDDQFESCTVLMVEHRSSATRYMDYQLKIKKGSATSIVGRQDDHSLERATRRDRQRREKEQTEARLLAIQGRWSMSDGGSSTARSSFEPLAIDTSDRRLSLQERRRWLRTSRTDATPSPEAPVQRGASVSSQSTRSDLSLSSSGRTGTSAPQAPALRAAPPPPTLRPAPAAPTLRQAPRAPVRPAGVPPTVTQAPQRPPASAAVVSAETLPNVPPGSTSHMPTDLDTPQQSAATASGADSSESTPIASSQQPRSNTGARRHPL